MDGGTTALKPSLSLDELEAQITELAGQLNAANYRWLTLIAEFDRRDGWADGKLPSCAHWLNFKCGLNLGAAREKVRVAHALAGLPKIAASMARGELSYSKVRAVSRVACPATEETLLMIALHGTAHHVERLVRGYRRAQEAEELSREAHQHANRALNYWFAEDGSLEIRGRMPAAAGALFIKALGAALETIPENEIRAEVVAEQPIRYESRRADALALRGAARSKALPRSPPRPRAALPAMRAFSACSRTNTASRSMSGAKRAASRRRYAAPSIPAMPVAAFLAAPTGATSMRTTSSTGPTAGTRNSTTSSPCAACNTAWFTRARSGSKRLPAAAGVSCIRTAGTSS